MTAAIRIPQVQSAAYRAAAHIYKTGRIGRAELFSRIHFSDKPGNCKQMLDRAIQSGWLEENPSGVALTPFARTHFGDVEEPAAKYVGQVATPRTPLWSAQDWPPIKQKNIPSREANRDVPDHSVRSNMSFRTVAGGSV